MSISEDGNQSMLLSEGEQRNLSEMSFNENDILEDILEESELKMNSDYPNEAYGDLMSLVTKHKLSNASNATDNAIIKFLINMQILIHFLFQNLLKKNANIWII